MTEWRTELIGFDKVVRMLAQAETQAVPMMGRALYEEGQLFFRKSQKEVPFRFGVLKGSGRLDTPIIRGNSVEVNAGYGGAASKYAEIVHNTDRMSFRNGKKSHYLSDPLEAAVPGMDDRVLKRISKIVADNG